MQGVFYTYSTSQFRLATFPVLNSHMGPVATTFDYAAIESCYSKCGPWTGGINITC